MHARLHVRLCSSQGTPQNVCNACGIAGAGSPLLQEPWSGQSHHDDDDDLLILNISYQKDDEELQKLSRDQLNQHPAQDRHQGRND
jgi:hypothetical protein